MMMSEALLNQRGACLQGHAYSRGKQQISGKHVWTPLVCRRRIVQLEGGSRSKKRYIVGVGSELQTASPATAQPTVDEVADVEVQVLDVTPGIVCLRGVCCSRLKIEIEYAMKKGTTDNCYAFLGADGRVEVLLDVPDQSFTKDYISALLGQGDLSGLRHIVISYLTPKRLPSLKALLEQVVKGRTDKLEVYLTNPALQLLRSTLGADESGALLLSRISIQVAKPASVISTSSGDTLRLIPCPTPRWPDLLATYSNKTKMLFSSKLFSAHVSPQVVLPNDDVPTGVFDEGGWGVYSQHWRYYFDCMLAPVARQAAASLEKLNLMVKPPGCSTTLGLESGWLMNSLKLALEKFGLASSVQQAEAPAVPSSEALEIVALCPLHGPAIKYATAELVRSYSDWTSTQIAASDACNIVVLYASAYGNTAALAQAISRGITKAGVGVEQLNLELCNLKDVNEAISRAAGFAIGSPTLGGHMPTQVQTALGTILRNAEARSLPCGVFGSFGWSGEAVDEMEQKLKDAGFLFGFDSIRCKFKPTQQILQVCEESGTDMAQRVKRKKQREAKAASGVKSTAVVGGSGAESALGRVVGTLCVVTARDGDAQSGMLASWVSQASFDPPGLTIAVKKDRAVEPLLNVGSNFVLNVLAEGSDRGIVKHMLRQFKPGEDRFVGLAVEESPVSGCLILQDAASYVECSTVQKMEAGDHWVLYAQVNSGKVLADGTLSSVHHRKIGTTY